MLSRKYIFFTELEYIILMRIPDINPQDFGKLFMKYRDSYVAIARSYVRDLAVAEDIVSDCFATFWDKRESIDLRTSPEAYILRAVKNRCLNWLRDNAKFVQAEGSLDPETNLKIKSMLSEISILESPGMADFFGSEVEAIFKDFLSEMSDLPRGIFLSSRFEDLTYDEIALKYNVTPRKVKREIQKSLEKLRSCLKDYLPV